MKVIPEFNNQLNLTSIRTIIFLTSLLTLSISCQKDATDEVFEKDMQRVHHEISGNSQRVDSILDRYRNTKNPYRKAYRAYYKLKQKGTTYSVKLQLNKYNEVLYSEFNDNENNPLRSKIIDEVMNCLVEQNPKILHNFKLIDSLRKHYKTQSWYNNRLQGEMWVHFIDYANKMRDLEHSKKALSKLKAIAHNTQDPFLQFQYLERRWYQIFLEYFVNSEEFSEEILSLSYQLLEKSKEINVEKYEWIALKRISESYYYLGLYDQSIEWKYKELKFLEKEKEYLHLASAYNNIGIVYEQFNKYQDAISHFRKAMDLYHGDSLDGFIARMYSNIGRCFLLDGQIDSSFIYFKKLEKNSKSILDKRNKVVFTHKAAINLANIASINGKHNQAEQLFQSIEESIQQSENQYLQGAYYVFFAEHKLRNREQAKAIALAEKSLEVILDNSLKTRLKAFEILIDSHLHLHNYKKALAYKQEHSALQQKHLNEKSHQKIESKKIEYAIQKKINEKEAQHQLELKNKSIQLYVSALLLLACVFLLIYFWKENQARKKILKMSLHNNKVISTKNDKLIELNDKLNHFAEILAHDIKLPIANIHQYLSYFKDKYHSQIERDDKEIFDILNQSTLNLNTMINVLLDYSSHNKSIIKDEKVNLNQSLSLVLNNLKMMISNTNTQIQIAEDLPVITANKSLIEQLLLNLISNAIKYKKPQQDLCIRIRSRTYTENYCLIDISDNGMGIPKEKQKTIFKIYNTHDHKIETDSSGIGLAVSKKVVEEFGGEIWVESEEGVGSTFYFTLPLVVPLFETEKV